MIPTTEALRELGRILAAGGVENPTREARLILAHALGVDLAALWALDEVDPEPALALARRRAAREPLAYITGAKGFWSLDLAVSPATLIPRPDSETLIEAALRHRPDRDKIRTILDLGTGTGALLLAALTEYPDACGLGIDRVPASCALARANAARTGLASRAAFCCADWAEAIAARFDLILANPPYIPSADIPGLMAEVAAHEPASALDGGADGFDAYRRIVADLPRLLAPGGLAILEAGIGQAQALIALAAAHGLDAAAEPDLAGIPRAVFMSGAGKYS
ncbi:MAG TPA: peptide chain release factor N(5)-glutamine methyltransferase [Acidiphilium sp.]|jgi:release factor glutamine methyltransferase|uniref:peptide chain release factor N(5)-glutamine methyltransferase n=1 Tax=unclassified Acidiphilium TaxID=2617493 RepID=UPI000BD90CBB|nr:MULTISPECIES: peptide chain release factor N(5)-glutamine methyltransferase [unclassified Acidiphilium]OYV56197.1 MAG: protein-(glutamine-N5) methyltransferase, release factor-specific [Acidiphilium sp. 20-67-58]HQT61366.1 peptide chain release factor N(5)-glutamine methyltransferase [Acidiphilium sp.]HQU11200.1 peptide chain release factor N(5)-glutamine methyltransferase [Acidiphilium sp.]